MATSLTAAAQRVNDRSFGALVQAAVAEYALDHDTDPLARALIRDPGFMAQMFVVSVADNATISADSWDPQQTQRESDVRAALSAVWAKLTAAVPNLGGA